MMDVAMLLTAMLGGIESLLKFICHVQLQCRGEDYTAGFINLYHSDKVWEAGKIWVLCKPKFLKLGEWGTSYVLVSYSYPPGGFPCWSLLEVVGVGILLRLGEIIFVLRNDQINYSCSKKIEHYEQKTRSWGELGQALRLWIYWMCKRTIC